MWFAIVIALLTVVAIPSIAEESEIFNVFNLTDFDQLNETSPKSTNYDNNTINDIVNLMMKTSDAELKENRTHLDSIIKTLRSLPLRVVSLIDEPYVNYPSDKRSEKFDYGPGVVMEILREFRRKNNIEFEFVHNKETQWGDQDANGTWNGLIEHLLHNDADIMAGAVIVREDRSNVVDYTQAFSDGYTGILIRAPDKFVDKRFIIVAKPFRWEVWALLVGFIVGTGILLKFLTRALEKETEVQYSTVGSLWIFYSVFLQQGLPIQPKSVTCRTLLAVWWLGALTLVATFTGNMVALFAVDKTKLPFDNEVEFVENVVHGEYKVVMTNSSMSRFLFLKESKVELYQKLVASMLDGKLIWVNNVREGIEMVKRVPNMALLAAKESLELAAAVDCDVVVLSTGILPVWYALCLRKHSELTKFFSKLIQHLIEQGFIVKWMKNTFDQLVKAKHGNCHNQDHVTTRSVAIDIAQVQGAFWILLSGAMLASSFLLTEYFIRLWKDKVKSDQLLLMASRKRLSYDNSDTIPMRRKSPSQFPDLLDFPNSFAKTDEFNGVTHRRAAKI